jgi:glycosyltransferase involved in cell wall biosynthesis
LLKNLLVFPKSLWLARIAREWQADHIHAHWASSTATMALIASEWTGIPWSVTAHRWDIVEDNLLSLKTRKAKFVRVISNSGENLVLDRLKPVQKTSNLFVIHMGVPRRSLPTSLALSNAPPVILTPASLLPVKGHTYLIRAMKLLEERGHPFNLWLAGEGELREALEAEVRDLHLEHRIRFLGQVPNERLHQMYRNGEVGVVALPSVDLGNNLHEGIPVSLMEAMSYRVPVIGTQAGGVPELLDGDHGLLVPPGDPQALADAIEKILLDPVFARELGARGQKRVEREFSVEAAVAQLVDRMQDREAVLA